MPSVEYPSISRNRPRHHHFLRIAFFRRSGPGLHLRSRKERRPTVYGCGPIRPVTERRLTQIKRTPSQAYTHPRWDQHSRGSALSSGYFMAPGGFTSETYGGYFAASAIGLYCYEYLLTFGTELRFVWRRRFSAGSLLFVVNRYAMLVSSLATIAQILPSWTCDAPVWLASVCNIVGGYAYMVFAALRMYALYGKNGAILFIVLAVGIISPLGQCFIMSVGEIRTSTPPGGLLALQWGVVRCHYEPRRTSLLSQAGINGGMVDAWFYLALRTHSLLFEILLLSLTWNRTLTRSNLRLPGFRAPFTTVLLRDGTLYFMVIAVILGLNLGGTAAAMQPITSPSSNKPTSSAIVTTLTLFSPLVDTITSICMSRFLLNLLAAAEGAFESEHCSSRWDTVMRFAKVETFGAPLRDTSECSSEDTLCADSIELLDMGNSNRV